MGYGPLEVEVWPKRQPSGVRGWTSGGRRYFVKNAPRTARLLSTTVGPGGCYSCYSWVDYGFSNDLPFVHVAAARVDGDQPAVFDQNFGRVERASSIP
jgi:hypothetical protein